MMLSLETIMGTLTIRDLKPAIVKRLKEKAKAHHRSLEGEVRALLEREAAQPSLTEWLAKAARTRARLPRWKPGQPTAADLVRDAREEER
jgi:plasmid stability protein